MKRLVMIGLLWLLFGILWATTDTAQFKQVIA
jgi:hypothetical protein